jgi:Ca-activated chloride channel homolog
MTNLFDLSLVAARPALLKDKENTVEVLIRVQAPDPPATGVPKRPRLNLAIVVDRSGSMSGEPLYQAKRAAAFMIDSLDSNDFASVVAYDDTVQVFSKTQPVSNKDQFKFAIGHIHEGGCTNLHGGWLKGADEAAKSLTRDCISRVLLLSDGNANNGLTNVDEIASQCSQLADKGVTTSTYGLGRDFNEELMTAMASAGRGNGYYSETAEFLLDKFREEFSLLAAICARDVRVRLLPLPGVKMEILNVYEQGRDESLKLPDLVYDGEAWVAVRLRIDGADCRSAGDLVAVLQASATYRDLTGTECEIPPAWLSLPVMTAEAYAAVPVDDAVIRRLNEAEAAKLQEFASRAARQQDWAQVDFLLGQARTLASKSEWLADVVENLEGLASKRESALFSKQAHYASSALGSRLRSKHESLAWFSDSDAPAHLQRKVDQGRSGHWGQDKEPKDKKNK